MDIDFNFSDIDSVIKEGMNQMVKQMKVRAEQAVSYAQEKGSYQDHSGTLRRSNKYKADETGVELYNDAQAENGHYYASNVESKGYEVLSSAALQLEKNLKNDFEK